MLFFKEHSPSERIDLSQWVCSPQRRRFKANVLPSLGENIFGSLDVDVEHTKLHQQKAPA